MKISIPTTILPVVCSFGTLGPAAFADTAQECRARVESDYQAALAACDANSSSNNEQCQWRVVSQTTRAECYSRGVGDPCDTAYYAVDHYLVVTLANSCTAELKTEETFQNRTGCTDTCPE